MKTFRFVLLLFLVLSISNTAWAQNQTVKGRVIDSKLKEALKKEKPKNETTSRHEDDQHLKPLGFKPR